MIRFVSLRIRLLRPLFLLSIIAGAAGAIGIFFFENQLLQRELHLRGQQLSNALAVTAETSASLTDFQRIVAAMAAEPNIEAINVVDLHLRPIFPGVTFDLTGNREKQEELQDLLHQANLLHRSVGSIDRHNANIYQMVTLIHVSSLKQDNVLKPVPMALFVNLHIAESRLAAITDALILTLLFSGIGLTALAMIYYLTSRWVLKPALFIAEVIHKHSLREPVNTEFKATDELGLIGKTFDDLTKTLAQREQALELAVRTAQEASLAKTQFLANMSHELRTPMNAILGMVSLLLKTSLTQRQVDYGTKIQSAATWLLGLLNDILDVSKAEAGKIELDPEPCSLDDLVFDLSVILTTALTHKDVALSFDIAPDIPRYWFADILRLKQVLINLGSNAIKFTRRGSVTISVALVAKRSANNIDSPTGDNNKTDRQYGTFQFAVQDSGIGIAPENHTKIFSEFTQAETSTIREFGGTGLGLSICQKLVRLMGGELKLTSALGNGSRFYFEIELPLQNDDEIVQFQQTAVNHQNHTQQSRLHSLRILLVEDNLNNQQIAFELLESEGATIQIANNGLEAVEMLRRQSTFDRAAQFDLVLMDLQMPVMDGLAATRIIRNELGLHHLPIVAMTANAMDSDRQECLNAGMNAHVGKPFDLDQLIALLLAQTGKPTPQPNSAAGSVKVAALKPVASSAISAADLAAAHGINLSTAVARFGGRSDRYLRLLPNFIASVKALPERLLAALNQLDQQTLARELHSIKGMAAQMGLDNLAQEAANGETLIRAQLDEREAAAAIQRVLALTEIAVPALTTLLHAMQTESENDGRHGLAS